VAGAVEWKAAPHSRLLLYFTAVTACKLNTQPTLHVTATLLGTAYVTLKKALDSRIRMVPIIPGPGFDAACGR